VVEAGYAPLYQRFANTFIVVAVGPEAQVDPRGFDRAVRLATNRLAGAGRPCQAQ
jgi:hypothetical protein